MEEYDKHAIHLFQFITELFEDEFIVHRDDMDYKTKKQQLVDEYNKTQQIIQQLIAKNQQILGQISLIEEIEKENETSKKDDQIDTKIKK